MGLSARPRVDRLLLRPLTIQEQRDRGIRQNPGDRAGGWQHEIGKPETLKNESFAAADHDNNDALESGRTVLRA